MDGRNPPAEACYGHNVGFEGGALELVRHPKQKAIDMIVNETYTDQDLVRYLHRLPLHSLFTLKPKFNNFSEFHTKKWENVFWLKDQNSFTTSQK